MSFHPRFRAALLILLTALGGCGPRLSEQEIGTPIFDIPKLPGSDAPYPLPQLDADAASRQRSPSPGSGDAEPQTQGERR